MNCILVKKIIEILHLVSKFHDIIDDDHRIRSHLRKSQKKIFEIFLFHRIDIDEVEKIISKCWNDYPSISPDRMNILDLAILEVGHRIDMHVPCLFYSRDRPHPRPLSFREGRGKFKKNRSKLQCRISIRCSDLENMPWIFFLDKFLEVFCILFRNIRNLSFESDLLDIFECEGDDLGGHNIT